LQGFLYSPAISAEELETWAAQRVAADVE
jgi:hypothetical protein